MRGHIRKWGPYEKGTGQASKSQQNNQDQKLMEQVTLSKSHEKLEKQKRIVQQVFSALRSALKSSQEKRDKVTRESVEEKEKALTLQDMYEKAANDLEEEKEKALCQICMERQRDTCTLPYPRGGGALRRCEVVCSDIQFWEQRLVFLVSRQRQILEVACGMYPKIVLKAFDLRFLWFTSGRFLCSRKVYWNAFTFSHKSCTGERGVKVGDLARCTSAESSNTAHRSPSFKFVHGGYTS
ncbi:hypothetical protein R1flu_020335 [Riccia fluitans]|uniref:Recombination activating protein 1 n=1 Tax=Riccia fluitans TaxID=41844 RepID=A0ABD1ZME2_9MARC